MLFRSEVSPYPRATLSPTPRPIPTPRGTARAMPRLKPQPSPLLSHPAAADCLRQVPAAPARFPLPPLQATRRDHPAHPRPQVRLTAPATAKADPAVPANSATPIRPGSEKMQNALTAVDVARHPTDCATAASVNAISTKSNCGIAPNNASSASCSSAWPPASRSSPSWSDDSCEANRIATNPSCCNAVLQGSNARK